MGIADRVRAAFGRATPTPEVRPAPVGGARVIPAEVVRDIAFLKLDADRAGGTADPLRASVAVFRCAMLISDAIARLPLRLYRGEEVIQPGTSSPAQKLAALLENPHPLMTSGRFVQTLVLHTLCHGQAFVYKDNEASTRIPTALKLLPPDRVEPVRKSRDLYELDAWRLGGSDRTQIIDPMFIIRVEYAPDPNDPLKGLSPIGVARTTAGADVQAAAYNNALLKNSGIPPLILKYLGKGQITPTQKAEYLRQWDERHSGPDSAGRPAFANADWDVIKLGMDARDMQFLQGRQWNLKEICRAFNVDPAFLGEHETAGLGDAGMRVIERSLYRTNVVPFATRIAQAFTTGLARPVDTRLTVTFDTDGVEALREDMTEKLSHAKGLRDLGCPVNAVIEKLELGIDDVEGGDVPLVPGGMVPLSDIVAPLPDAVDVGSPAPVPTVSAETTVLNGAQITAAVSIVQSVASGQMPRDSAVGLLVTMFHVTPAQAEAMLGSAGTGATTQPNIPEGGAVVNVETPTVNVEPDRAWSPTPDRLRLWRAYVRKTEPLERKMHAALRREFMRQRASVLAALDGNRAAGPADAFDPDAVARAVKPSLLASYDVGETTAVADMKLTTDAPMKGAAKRAEDYYTERFPMLRGVGEYVRGRLEATIAEGVKAGDNLSDMKDRVRETMNDSVRHARVVARTEVASATNIARDSMFRRNGVKTLEWLSAGDDNVRESHQIDGETINAGDSFSNGLAFPNDPSGPAEECVGCRCVALPGATDAESTDDDTEE